VGPAAPAFNTASTFGDAEPQAVYNTESFFGGCEMNIDQGMLDGQQMLSEDRLGALRMTGSQIQQSIVDASLTEQQQAMFMCGSVPQQQQFFPAAAMTQFAAMEACFAQLPSEPPVVNASMLPIPPPPPLETAPQAPAVIRLSEALPPPELGGPILPSIGSMGHHCGECKPCTFFHTRGCENAEACQFCHLCGPGEKKKRLRAEKAAKRDAQSVAVRNARTLLASLDAAEQRGEIDFIVE